MKTHKKIHLSYLIVALAVISMGAAYSARAMLEIGPIATVTGTIPEIRFLDSTAGDADWEIECVGQYFDLDTEGSASPVFRVHSGADTSNLVLDANGNVAINGLAAQTTNELEVMGNTGTSDNFAAVAISPGGVSADSARMSVNGFSDSVDIGVRTGSGGYNSIFRGDLDAPNHSIAVDAQGDVAVGGVSYENISPIADLQIGGTGRLFLDPAGTAGDWYTNVGFTGFFLTKPTTGRIPFGVENDAPSNSIRVVDSGDVGMGTPLPDAALHIVRNNGTSNFKVEENSPTVKIRQLFELINNGGVRFALENTDVGERWDFTNNTIGDFLVNRIGTGGPEMSVTKLGRFVSGPGGFAALDSRPNGNLFIAGTLFESSDRDKKENFQEVDCQEVLDKVAELSITTWNYKSDEETIRHMGPVAQDFQAAFKLGDSDKTIATTDKAGISLAAIKALNSKVQQQQNKIVEKDGQIEMLENSVEEMTVRLERLEVALEQLIPQ
jgi:hypothetical protein